MSEILRSVESGDIEGAPIGAGADAGVDASGSVEDDGQIVGESAGGDGAAFEARVRAVQRVEDHSVGVGVGHDQRVARWNCSAVLAEDRRGNGGKQGDVAESLERDRPDFWPVCVVHPGFVGQPFHFAFVRLGALIISPAGGLGDHCLIDFSGALAPPGVIGFGSQSAAVEEQFLDAIAEADSKRGIEPDPVINEGGGVEDVDQLIA